MTSPITPRSLASGPGSLPSERSWRIAKKFVKALALVGLVRFISGNVNVLMERSLIVRVQPGCPEALPHDVEIASRDCIISSFRSLSLVSWSLTLAQITGP